MHTIQLYLNTFLCALIYPTLIQRMQTYMRNTEVYDGISSDDNADDDVTKWRSHWNIGISQQSQFKN